MLWSHIRSWAKEKGYKSDRTKLSKDTDEEETHYLYRWSKISDESINGEASSVSKLAKAIFNHITNNAHIEYQMEYLSKLESEDINYEKPI